MTGNITAVQTGSGWDVDQTGTANLQGDLQSNGSIILNAQGTAAVAAAQNRNVVAVQNATYGGCMDALTRLQATGQPGVIALPRDGLDISSAGQPLPLVSNIIWDGNGYGMSGYDVMSNGCVVTGNGTFAAFSNAATDFGSLPANITAARAEMAYRTGVRNVGMNNVSYGVKSGALYKVGSYNSEFTNLMVFNPTQWAFWFENFLLSKFTDLKSHNPAANAKGHFWFGGSTGALWNHGNAEIKNLFSEFGGTYTRNLVFAARGSGSAMNDIDARFIQTNGAGGRFTATATFINGDVNIGVPDASKYPVDFPVCVETNVYGYTQYTSYFVVSSNTSTNKIQLAYQMGGTPVTPSGSGTATLVAYGWPSLEIVGYGDPNANTIQASQFSCVDAESFSTAMRVVQNAAILADFGTTNTTQGTQCANSLTARTSTGSFRSAASEIFDFDWASAGGLLCAGSAINSNATLASASNQAPQGLVRTYSGDFGLHLGTNQQGVRVALKAVNSPAQPHIYPAHSFSQKIITSTATSLNLNGQYLGCVDFTGTANATWTLPTLSGTSGGAANTYLGGIYEIGNCSTSAGITLTINTGTGQPFNRQSGKTSVALALGQSFSVRACYDSNSASWYWKVVGNNGVTI